MSYKEQLEKCEKEYRVKSMELLSSYKDGYIGKDTYQVTLENGVTKKVDRITKAGGNGEQL